ncbi:unnamed protein product [Larinioides sclopetarius]
MYNISIHGGELHRNNIEIVQCDSWEYDHSHYKRTIVDQWNLVCDREWLVSMAKTVYMLGFLFGSIANGQLSDRFGRRKVMLLCLCIFLVFAFLTLLSENIIMFLIFRFFLAFGLTSLYVNSAVILSEITSAQYRSIYVFAFKFGYILGYPLTPLIAWLVPDWFWLQLIFTLPWLSLLCAFWILPETPKWLLSHRKFSELEKVLLHAAEKNGKDMKQAQIEISDFVSYHSQRDYVEEKATMFDLLRPKMRKNTINIFFSWFINSYIYFALSWNTNDLAGDPYWNFFITGAVELPEVFVFIFLCRYIGNRLGLAIANVLSGICLIGMVCVPPDMVWLTISLAMSGKFFCSGAFDTEYVYTPELYPTVLRNVAIGSSSTVARISALVSPFIHPLADVTYPWVPMAVPGALSILSGLLVLLLPETKGKILPDTLEEGEIFFSKQEAVDSLCSVDSKNKQEIELKKLADMELLNKEL